VVKNIDTHNFPGFGQSLGQVYIILGSLRVTGRMVMGKDY